MKKLISVILSLVLALSAFGVVAYAEDIAEPLVFEVNEEGYAVLISCDSSVEGDVVIPAVVKIDGEFYEVKYIGENAFEGCELITSVELAEGIEQIDDMAFFGCISLKDLYIPESLVFCAYTAFNGTEGVTVHCYSSNYQFFTVFGIIQSLRIDIVDMEDDSLDLGIGNIGSIDMMNTILLAVKRILQLILYFFINYGTDVEPDEAPVEPDNGAVIINTPVTVF